jgi:adenosylcobinamide amidohydrolase
MNNTTVSHEQFRELEVVTVCTGGVETNAGRAGDPADYYESEGGFIKLREEASPDGPGTINLMVFINQELTLSALVRSVVTVTEAKTSVLEELAVGSKFSDGSATGTGTDQVGVSCLKGTTPALTWAGKHDKLGELIGVTVRNALKETLARQNGLTPEKQCSASVHLERFGTDRDSFRLGVMKLLSEQRSDLLCRNFDVIDRDPMTVAAVTALTHLLDKVRWKLIPHTCLPEILCSFGAQAAAAVSGKYDRISWYRDALSQKVSGTDNASFLALLQESFALGFDDKWD